MNEQSRSNQYSALKEKTEDFDVIDSLDDDRCSAAKFPEVKMQLESLSKGNSNEELDDAIKMHFGKKEALPTQPDEGSSSKESEASGDSEAPSEVKAEVMEGKADQDEEYNDEIQKEIHSIVAKRVLDLVNYRDYKGFGAGNIVKAKPDAEGNDSDGEIDMDTDDELFTCGCKVQCLDEFYDIDQHRLDMREKKKVDKELHIMKALKPSDSGDDKNPFTFTYKGKKICKDAFKYAYDVDYFTLRALIKHTKRKGPVPRNHGNANKQPANTLKYEQVQFCVNFIVNQGKEHGISVPSSSGGKGRETPVFLPSHFTKKAMHEEYVVECDELSQRYAGITTFKKIWRRCCPHIKISDDDYPFRMAHKKIKFPFANAEKEMAEEEVAKDDESGDSD